MVVPLLARERVDLLLILRANGEQPRDLATQFGLNSEQISRLIYKHRGRLRAICAGLGVPPPKRGGSFPSGRRRVRELPGFHSKPIVDTRPPPKIIPCLGCGEDHHSTWAGDRMCRGCKQSENWHGGDGLSGEMESSTRGTISRYETD